MIVFIPSKVYFEEAVKEYKQGRELLKKYEKLNIPLIQIEGHHKIEELRQQLDKEFTICFALNILH